MLKDQDWGVGAGQIGRQCSRNRSQRNVYRGREEGTHRWQEKDADDKDHAEKSKSQSPVSAKLKEDWLVQVHLVRTWMIKCSLWKMRIPLLGKQKPLFILWFKEQLHQGAVGCHPCAQPTEIDTVHLDSEAQKMTGYPVSKSVGDRILSVGVPSHSQTQPFIKPLYAMLGIGSIFDQQTNYICWAITCLPHLHFSY